MTLRFFHVDAFTDASFAGNPAGVCVSETSFLLHQDDGFALRWFTPAAEVALCGHGTLAAAYVLWETGELGAGEEARFHTRSGLLTAERTESAIWLDFPGLPETPAEASSELLAGLGIAGRPRYVGRIGNEYLVEIEDEDQLRGLRPDFAGLRALPGEAVVVTSRSESDRYDFVSRCFCRSRAQWHTRPRLEAASSG